MHFCTLALPLVFFSLVFAKVVCVVFSSVLCFCVVKILDLDRRAKFFPLFFTFFFCLHLSSFSLSFLFFFPFCFFLLSFVSCLLSCWCLPPLCYLELLPHHLILLLRFVTSSCCLIISSLPLRFVAASSLCHPHGLVVLSSHCCFVASS
jgi:hypothetical protein